MRRTLTSAPRWAVAVLAVAILVLVALTALGSRGLPGTETRPPPFLVDFDLLVVMRVMVGILAGLAALLLILLLLPGGPPIKLSPRTRTSPMRMLVGMVLILAVLLLLQPFFNRTEQEPEPLGAADNTWESGSPGTQQSGSRWGLLVLGGAVLLVVVGIAAASRSAPAEEPEDLPGEASASLTGVIDTVLAELEESTDPRKVVIGAYVRMERALTAAGLPRSRSEAPLEYLARALRRLDVSRPAVGRLTRLFELARFSHHEILPDMSRDAISALVDIRTELSGVVS